MTLVILVVVTALGLMALRAGMLNVAVSTNSQVSTLLLQSADAGVTNIQDKINGDTAAAQRTTGLIGMVTNTPGVERVGCVIKSGVRMPTLAANSRCASSDYLSSRDAVTVQFAMVSPASAAGGAQMMVSYGSDAEAGLGGSPLVRIYSTSVIPNFGGASSSAIQSCLAANSDDATDPSSDVLINACLNNEKASATTVVQEFSFGSSGYKQ